MTVCIAAYGNIRPGGFPLMVVAADRMITIDQSEWEPSQTKAVNLATQTVALFAGQMEVHAIVCPATIQSLTDDPPRNWTVKEIADRYADEFAKLRRQKAEREMLFPLNLSFEEFQARQKEFTHEFVRDVSENLLNSRLRAEAIIAGVDQTGAHIYKVLDPGIAYSFDTPCFASIGLGASHAESYFMTSGFNKNVGPAELSYTVFSAKMKAEIAAGVGSQTDMFYVRGKILHPIERTVTLEGGTFSITEKEKEQFRKIFDWKRARDKKSEALAINKVQTLIEEAAQKLPIAPAGSIILDQASELNSTIELAKEIENSP